jgi:hypothetical protein
VVRAGCVSCLYWIELAVCRVCIATDRQNKSIITIIKQKLIKSVCCSASHRERYWGSFGWIECQGCEGVVSRIRASGAVTALACRGRHLPYISCQNSTSRDVSRPVIDICGGVQFVVDRNTEG